MRTTNHVESSPYDPSPSNSSHKLTIAIAIAIVAAIGLAMVRPTWAANFELGGEIFISLLKMMVVPLVFVSVIAGVLELGDVRKLGRPGGFAVLYCLATTFIAVLIGLAVVNALQPGVGTVDPSVVSGLESPSSSNQTAPPPSVSIVVKNLLLMLVTDNLFVSAAEGQLLPIIVFAVAFAAMLTTIQARVNTLSTLIRESNIALMQFVMWLMILAPLGIFCLVASRFGKAQVEGNFWTELSQTGGYFAAVIVGLAIQGLIVLPLIFWFFRRENPFVYMLKISQALLTAFSTASSSATLPITMQRTIAAGVSRKSSELVIPLGSTINMNGTGLYEAVAAIFIAQVIGRDLTMLDQATIAITATLAAIGAAGIPEAGLVTMLIVLGAVGLPVEYAGLVLTVDWLLDRFRTTLNVLGDSIGAAVIDKSMPPDSIVEGHGE